MNENFDYLANNLYAVGKRNDIGLWNGNSWQPQECDWSVLQIISDLANQFYVVGTDYNVGLYDPTTGNVQSQGHMGHWDILYLAFDIKNTLYCVGKANNIGLWNGIKWVDAMESNKAGGSSEDNILTIAFDGDNCMWCVDKSNDVYQWNGDAREWDKQDYITWDVISLTFDIQGNLLIVGTKYDVGCYAKDPNGFNSNDFTDLGHVGGWDSLSLFSLNKLISQTIEYDNLVVTSGNPEAMSYQVFSNPTDATITQTYTTTYQESASQTYAVTTRVGLGVTSTTTVEVTSPKVPFVTGSQSIEYHASASLSLHSEETVSKSRTESFQTEIEVPPHTSIQAHLELGQSTLTGESSVRVNYRGVEHEFTGPYNGENTTYVQIVTKQI
jgi:DNA-binding transcriptional regulator/RsmH inhibitor MraZ